MQKYHGECWGHDGEADSAIATSPLLSLSEVTVSVAVLGIESEIRASLRQRIYGAGRKGHGRSRLAMLGEDQNNLGVTGKHDKLDINAHPVLLFSPRSILLMMHC